MTEVWITRLVPARAQAFARLARLDKPAGIWLLLWPCWWSVALASPHFPDWTLLILFAAGAAVMRAAGCVVNDVADKDFDAKVERTKNRPIASGAIDLRSAHIFLGALLLCGLVILLCFNRTAELVGVASLPLIFVYPFTKRITHWPQAFLGLTFNWGALMGWAAVTETLDWPAFLLYFSGMFWTLGYDTIYAHQDKEDDLLIGVRSTALKLGARTRPYLFIFYGLGLAGMAVAGISAKLDPIFFAGLALGAGQLFWQAAGVKLDDPADCLAKFRSNFWFGLIVFVSIVIARVTPFGI